MNYGVSTHFNTPEYESYTAGINATDTEKIYTERKHAANYVTPIYSVY
jgi:hypothetical protein